MNFCGKRMKWTGSDSLIGENGEVCDVKLTKPICALLQALTSMSEGHYVRKLGSPETMDEF
jgi:hypothetical protein